MSSPVPSNVAFRSGGRGKEIGGLAVAVLCGVGMAGQSRVNGEFGGRVGDAVLTGVVSFGGGMVLLLAALVCVPRLRAGLRRVRSSLRARDIRPWHCLGGIAGATYVLGQSVTVTVIGVAMFTVAVVAGQTVSGLVVDRFGIGPSGPRAVTWPRLLGAVLMGVGVCAAAAGDLLAAEGGRVWALLFPVASGVAMAVQQAFNGRVGAAVGSPLTATFVNFTVGTTVLLLSWGVSLIRRGSGGLPTSLPTDPVLYLGGPLGVVFIAVASVLVSRIGVLVFGLASVAGQLLGSLALDLVVPATGAGVAVTTVIGCAVALIAVVVASMGGRRGTGRVLKQSVS